MKNAIAMMSLLSVSWSSLTFASPRFPSEMLPDARTVVICGGVKLFEDTTRVPGIGYTSTDYKIDTGKDFIAADFDFTIPDQRYYTFEYHHQTHVIMELVRGQKSIFLYDGVNCENLR